MSRILSANTSHLDQILQIEKMEFENPWTFNQIKADLLSIKNSENLVYLINDEVVGYILGSLVLDEFHLNNIAVKKNFQSIGIGRMLMENLFYRLKNKKIKRIYLEVSDSNLHAQKLYKKMGFDQYGVRRNYYKGAHALLFNLDLK
tara:strand:- start:77 stop:514 length:438 start_codon:yes stop_codon:yes gene_type:complete